MGNNKPNDMFLLMLNLAQISDTSKIKSIFIETLSSLWKPIIFKFEGGPSRSGESYTIKTINNYIGFINFSDSKANLNSVDKSLIHNSVAMLAVVLENRLQEAQLQDERKLLEEKIKFQTREHEEARIIAENANRAKGVFLANMSHEIRTPMTAILGFSELLLSKLPPENQNYVEMILRNGKHLLRIIDDIMSLSRIEFGSFKLSTKPICIEELFNDVVNITKPKLETDKVTFTSYFDKNIPHTLLGDEMRIKQILINLLDNAVKYTESGSIQLSVEKTDDKEVVTDNIAVQFSVKDTGIGISEQQIASIFKPFVQGDESNSRAYDGVGLGLAIVKKLVESMDGVLEVSSEINAGSKFNVTLKLMTPKSEKIIKSSKKFPIEFPKRYNGKRVLIAEDNPDNQLLIQNYLAELGFSFDFANNGQEALDQIKKSNYDLILMDLRMPVMDGFQAVQKIRESGDDTPIIAISAHTFNNKRHAQNLGIDCYLTKPIQLPELYSSIEKLCGKDKR